MSTETISPPICEKHGCEKVWAKHKSRKAGGQWRGQWKCSACVSEHYKNWVQANREKEAARKRAWSQANREKEAARKRAWHQENLERCREINRAWRHANRERRAATVRAWQHANPEKRKATCRAWSQANPEKEAAKTQRRLARKHNAIVPGREVTAAIEAERKALFNGCCFCGADKKLELEHMVPLSNGGLHVEENLLGACRRCNASKNDRPVEAWFRKQPFFSEQRWQEIQSVTEGS